MSNTLPIVLTRLLEHILTIKSVWTNLTLMTTMLRVGSLYNSVKQFVWLLLIKYVLTSIYAPYTPILSGLIRREEDIQTFIFLQFNLYLDDNLQYKVLKFGLMLYTCPQV